jgi:hypothetical protein
MDTMRQILEWKVDDACYALTGEPGRWTLTTPDCSVELSASALCALAEALVRLGLVAPPPTRSQPKRERAGKPWTDEEDAELEQQHQGGTSRREIARLHGRSVGAITARLVHLGLESHANMPLPSQRPSL